MLASCCSSCHNRTCADVVGELDFFCIPEWSPCRHSAYQVIKWHESESVPEKQLFAVFSAIHFGNLLWISKLIARSSCPFSLSHSRKQNQKENESLLLGTIYVVALHTQATVALRHTIISNSWDRIYNYWNGACSHFFWNCKWPCKITLLQLRDPVFTDPCDRKKPLLIMQWNHEIIMLSLSAVLLRAPGEIRSDRMTQGLTRFLVCNMFGLIWDHLFVDKNKQEGKHCRRHSHPGISWWMGRQVTLNKQLTEAVSGWVSGFHHHQWKQFRLQVGIQRHRQCYRHPECYIGAGSRPESGYWRLLL